MVRTDRKETTMTKSEQLSKEDSSKLELKNFKVITKRPDGTKRVQTINTLPSRTNTSHAIGTNPNEIVRKYGYANLPSPEGGYADFSQLPDLMEARKTILQAEKSFMELPSNVRTKFKNDPNELINFLNSSDEHDIQESIKLGLRNAPAKEPLPDPTIAALKEIAANTKPQKRKQSDD